MHLEGSPADIGYQHGYLLAPEIRDTLQTVSLEMTHEEKHDWQFFREKAQNMLWPHVEPNTAPNCRASPTARPRAA